MIKEIKKGFTLVEVLISAVIFAAILGFAISFLIDSRRQAALSTVKGQLRVEAQKALKSMEEDISACAVKIKEIDEETGSEIYEPNCETGQNTLVIRVIDKENTGKLLFDQEETPVIDIVYKLNNNTIVRQFKGESRTIARDVKSFVTGAGEGGENTLLLGSIKAEVTTEAPVPGFDQKKPSTYTSSVLATVRQLQNKSIVKGDSSDNYQSKKVSRWRQHISEPGSGE